MLRLLESTRTSVCDSVYGDGFSTAGLHRILCAFAFVRTVPDSPRLKYRMRLSILLSLVSLLTCTPTSTSPVEAPRRLMGEVPADTDTVIQYAGEVLSRESYDQRLAAEERAFLAKLSTNHKNLTFRTRRQKYFHIAYRTDEARMNHLARYLEEFYRQVYPLYFIYESSRPVRLVYYRTKAEFQEHTGSPAYGFYRRAEHTLYTYANSGHGTLWHELIHAFLRENEVSDYDPQWFHEGFASFYEMAFLTQTASGPLVVAGYANWRLPAWQRNLRRGAVAPLREALLRAKLAPDYDYAAARFLFCYLWTRGKMQPFVRAVVYDLMPRYEGVELREQMLVKLENITGESVEEIEANVRALALRTRKNEKLRREL